MKKTKIKRVEVFPNFRTDARFFVPLGKRYGNQLQAALDNGFYYFRGGEMVYHVVNK